jgi:antitoxin component of MazEF toxin-antitoxin module
MKKRLSRVGDRLGLILDQSILDSLNIDQDTVLELSTQGGALVVRPVPSSRAERLRAATERVVDAHTGAFEHLAGS